MIRFNRKRKQPEKTLQLIGKWKLFVERLDRIITGKILDLQFRKNQLSWKKLINVQVYFRKTFSVFSLFLNCRIKFLVNIDTCLEFSIWFQFSSKRENYQLNTNEIKLLIWTMLPLNEVQLHLFNCYRGHWYLVANYVTILKIFLFPDRSLLLLNLMKRKES